MMSLSRASRVLALLFLLAAPGYGLEDGTMELEALSRRLRPSVVEILGTIESSGDTSYGTGFVLREPSLVVTNAHVIRGVAQVMVRTWEGALLASVEVLHVDEKVDLAVLRVTGLKLEPLDLAASSLPPVGERVLAIGHPRGYEFTVSDGIVSAVRRLDEKGVELIQTTAPISPGSSGGPLVNMEGRVVGVCSLTLTEGQNINFAVPAREVGPVLDRALRIEAALADEDPTALPPRQLARMVRAYRLEGDLTRATELVRRALPVYPRDPGLLGEAAEVAWARGNYDEVRALIDRIETIDPDYAPAHQLRAAYLAQNGECPAAIGEAERALAGDLGETARAEAHAVLAECLGRKGDVAAALDHVELALEDGAIAALPDYHALRAFLLQASGREEAADAAALAALEAARWDPLVVAALRERGLPRLLEIVSYRAREEDGRRIVRGVVRNRGPVPIEQILVSAEGFDGGEVLVATGTSTVSPERLVPGQSGAFEIALSGNPAEIASLSVRVVDYQE
ncbi:MAG: trypsin-like peptidase domain-containing protein [Acidobacteriota bacterium]|nr:trypsin-like peptidase domain-containing protein [Acidobacteriota bacterium]MDQ7086652.1 trypsin-like peptidase domain-containing protein [Acidobacteriota bacterium]